MNFRIRTKGDAFMARLAYTSIVIALVATCASAADLAFRRPFIS
jgi:hypothetical protein